MADAIEGNLGFDASRTGTEVFNVRFTFADAAEGRRVMSLNPSESLRYRLESLTAFPSTDRAMDQIKLNAMKLIFVRSGNFREFLHQDEQVSDVLPSGTDASLVSLQGHARALNHESTFRRFLSNEKLRGISEAIAANRPDFQQRTIDFFQEIAVTLPHRLSISRMSRFVSADVSSSLEHAEGRAFAMAIIQGATEIAGTYRELESRERARGLVSALKNSPSYLTEASREDLKGLIGESMKAVAASLLIETVGSALLRVSVDQLPPMEQALVMLAARAVADSSFVPASLTDSVMTQFEHYRTQSDMNTALKRWELAERVSRGVDLMELIERYTRELGDAAQVPVHMIPQEPQAGQVLLAMRNDHQSQWAQELIQYGATRVERAGRNSSARARARVYSQVTDIVTATPVQMLRLAETARSRLTDGAIREMRLINERRAAFPFWRWRSIDARMREILRASTASSTQRVLRNLLRVGRLADRLETSALRDHIRNAFLDIVNNSSPRALDQLVTEIRTGRDYIDHFSGYFPSIFADAEVRYPFLRQQLVDSNTFLNYLRIKTQDLGMRVPVLFEPLRLNAATARATGNTGTVMFYQLVHGVRQTLASMGADTILGVQAVNAIREHPEVVRGDNVFAQDALSSVTPDQIITAALAGSNNDPSMSVRIVEWFRAMRGQFVEGASEEGDWPRFFKMRDIIPAAFDRSAQNPQRTAERIIIASLLGPWLKSGARATVREQGLLLAAGADNRAALVQSEAYRMAISDAGPFVSEGLREVQEEALRWRRTWDTIKYYTMRTQEYSGYLFYATMFLDIPQVAHIAPTYFMAGSSAVDLAADIGLFVEYYNNYNTLMPFAGGGALGHGMVSHVEIERMRQELAGQAHLLFERIPMDLWFYGSVGHGAAQMTMQFGSMGIQWLRMRALARRHRVTVGQLGSDLDRLARAYAAINQELTASAARIGELFSARERDLRTRAQGSGADATAAREELQKWITARDIAAEFDSRYPELRARMMENAETRADAMGSGEPAEGGESSDSTSTETPAGPSGESGR